MSNDLCVSCLYLHSVARSLIRVLAIDNKDSYLGHPASRLQSPCVQGEHAGRVVEGEGSDKSNASLILTWWQAGLSLKCQEGLAWEFAAALSADAGEEYQLRSVPDHETEKIWNGQSNCKSFTLHPSLDYPGNAVRCVSKSRVLYGTNELYSTVTEWCVLPIEIQTYSHLCDLYQEGFTCSAPPSLATAFNVYVIVNVSLILSGCI